MASATPINLALKGIQSSIDLEDVICPICLEIPHNAVLLNCNSYNQGCRTLICDTNDSQSNCLARYKRANGLPPTTNEASSKSLKVIPLSSDSSCTCPFCREKVKGFVVVDEVREYLDMKKRCCEEKKCPYVGNFMELQQHVKQEHRDSRPTEVDPRRQQDWDNLQRFSETRDVLSTIHALVPHGVVDGDYVIDFGDESGDEFDDLTGDAGNWWISCILYHVFERFRSASHRQQ